MSQEFEFEVIEEMNPYRCITRMNGDARVSLACSPNWTVRHHIPAWSWRRAWRILRHGFEFECQMIGPEPPQAVDATAPPHGKADTE